MRVDGFHISHYAGFRHQVMGNFLEYLAIDQKVGINEHIKRVGHHTFCRILDRDYSKSDAPSINFTEYLSDAIGRNILSGRPEFLHTGHVRKRSPRAQIGNLLRAFEREGGGHDFSIDWPNGLGWKWSGVLLHKAFDDRRLPRRGMEIGTRIFLFLDLADFDDTLGPLIQQAQDLIIDAIDFFPVVREVLGHN